MKTIRKYRAAMLALCLLLLSSAGLADHAMANPIENSVQTSTIGFSDESSPKTPKWKLLNYSVDSMTFDFSLNSLDLKQQRATGQQWHSIEIVGAVEHGQPGRAGLPVLSKLIAVPAGHTLSVEILESSSSIISDLHIFPVQNPDAEDFSFLKAAYQVATPFSTDKPEIVVGSPVSLAGQSVAALNIHLADYNAPAQEARIWTDLKLRFTFLPDAKAGAQAATPRKMPHSFAREMNTTVLGFQELQSSSAVLSENTPAPFGTYLAIYFGVSGIESGISPLLQWRREQGYHVELINTSQTGNSTSSIKAAIQNVYDDSTIPPLEFVTIFGDADGNYSVPTWFESLSGYHGGGDHYYSMLDGDDILSDVHIGRISFSTQAELNTIVGKILGYEKTPPMDNTDWYGRALLQGDPASSGITTIYTNQWVKGQLQGLGWAQIDTTWSGNFVNPMMAHVGQGVTAYGYRGYLGTSGISNGHVNNLNNGGRLAIAILPTCASGSFTYTTGRSEAWLRAPNGGAVAAVGTATTGTHTRYNNCYYLGIWDGLLNSHDHRIGSAHTQGKMDLYAGYFLAEPDRAEIWAVWNNIMGDPATEMWTSVPRTLDVTYPSQISIGQQAVSFQVSYQEQPVSGARICLYQSAGASPSGTRVVGITDANGQVVLDVPAQTSQSFNVTVTNHNFLPHIGGLSVGTVDVFCAQTQQTINDGGDGNFNPGETADLNLHLTNHGTSDAFAVTAELTVLDGPATIDSGSLSFGNIASGSEVAAAAAAVIVINSDATEGDIVRLLLTATDGNQIWTSLVEETVRGASFSVSAVNLEDFGGSMDPGESGRFSVTLHNLGSLTAESVSATLTTDSPWVTITDATSSFGHIGANASAEDLLSPFQVSVSTDCFGGHLVNFELTINYADGLQAIAYTVATVGTASSDQPTGPDAYGYYAFDNTDTVSELAPEYNWVGIDPDHGAQGTDLELSDFGWEQDDTKTIDLPFDFNFYGEKFDRISICSNGWLAMGETPVNFYRNFPLPASHSAGALIAPFWDNLNQTGNKKVYTWYDESEHRFIVQWYEMPNHFSGSIQNFEVILMDPAFHATSTGDGMIIFQYAEVHNTDSRDGYATVGIQNLDRTDGIDYSYWNQYAPGGAPLQAGRAILFVPMGSIAQPAASISPASMANTVVPDDQVTEYLHITNNGEENSVLNFTVDKVDPATIAGNKSAGSSSGDEFPVEPASLQNSEVTSTTDDYEPGSTIDLPLHVVGHSPDDEWLMKVDLELPAGVTVNSADDLSTPHEAMDWNGQTGNGVTTTWGAVGWGSGAFFADGESGNTSVNLTFDESLTGAVVIGWTVYGDQYGGDPHQVSGQIVLDLLGPTINVSTPVNNQVAVIGEQVEVNFQAVNGPEMVIIDLQREMNGSWEILALGIDAENSPWTWLVTGEPTSYAQIRVRDASDGSVFGLSSQFVIGRNLDWIQPATSEGSIMQGETLDLAITMDSTGLSHGEHVANIVISGNGGAPFTLSVTLTVSDASAVGDLPGAVTLLGNHPNPFNPQTSINFSLPSDQNITLKIYSTRGRLVRSLLSGDQPAGLHHAVWDGRDKSGRTAASGVYFYRLETDEGNFTGKMVLTK